MSLLLLLGSGGGTGTLTVEPAAIASDEAVPGPAIVQQTQEVELGDASAGPTVDGPTLTMTVSVILGDILSAEALGGPVVFEPRSASVGSVNDQPAVGAPWVENDQTTTNAVQYVTLGNATGGTATLDFAGQVTGAIAWNASGATVQAALEALANIGPGDVVVTGAWPEGVSVTFTGAYAGQAVAQLVLNTAGLVGPDGADVEAMRVGGRLRGRISVDVVPRANPGGAGTELVRSWARQAHTELREVGSGAATVQNNDPARAAVGYFDLLRIKKDGRVRQTVVVERQRNQALRRAKADRHTTFSGRGPMALLEDGIVLPYFGTDVELWSDVRAFNFASPDYDDSGWTAAPVPTTTHYEDSAGVPYPGGKAADFPARWPDLDAAWLWDRFSGYNNVPAGPCYFRTTFTVAEASNAEPWAAADDAYEFWLDGARILADNAEGAVYLGQSKAAKVWLRAGTHYLAVYARNTTEMLKAGALWSIMRLNGVGSFTGVYARSTNPATTPTVPVIGGAATVKLLPYPPTPPGFTPGKVVRLLLAEAQARGTCAGITLGFTDYADSAGVAWPVTADIAFPLGLDLLSAVRQLGETYCDFAMSPLLVLDAWVGGQGANSPTVLAHGGQVPVGQANVTALTFDGQV